MKRRNMRTKSACFLVVLGTVVLVGSAGRGDTFGFKGRADVTKIELGYVPASKTLKGRVRIVGTPDVVEFQTTDAETIDRLIRLTDMKTRGARMAVELEGGEVKAWDLVVGGAAD
jgi:hypothetical protein